MRVVARLLGPAVCAAIIAVPVACGPGNKDRSTVTGNVSLGNSPFVGANVMFKTSDGRTGSAITDENGNYNMTDAPQGEVTVTITVPQVGGEARMRGGIEMPKGPPDITAGMKQPAGNTGAPNIDPSKLRPVPDKYTKAESSPLKFKVNKGTQKYDIPLSP